MATNARRLTYVCILIRGSLSTSNNLVAFVTYLKDERFINQFSYNLINLLKCFKIHKREKIEIRNEWKILINDKADVTIYEYKKNYLLKEFQMHFTGEYEVIYHV